MFLTKHERLVVEAALSCLLARKYDLPPSILKHLTNGGEFPSLDMEDIDAIVQKLREDPHEGFYCWRVRLNPEDHASHLIIPRSDPFEHEYPADGLFMDVEEAAAYKEDLAEDGDVSDWILCYGTLRIVREEPKKIEEEECPEP